jgi:hypothetical protein
MRFRIRRASGYRRVLDDTTGEWVEARPCEGAFRGKSWFCPTGGPKCPEEGWLIDFGSIEELAAFVERTDDVVIRQAGIHYEFPEVVIYDDMIE